MNRSTPGFPVHHQLLEFTETHAQRVSDAIQPSHPLSSPSPPAPNPSQHQSLFQWVNSSHEVAKVLEFQLEHHSFQRNPRANPQSFPDSWVGIESTCNAGDPSLIPRSGRSPGEGKGYPPQDSGLENFMDCIVHGVAKSQTQLSDFHFTSQRRHRNAEKGWIWALNRHNPTVYGNRVW